MQEFATRLSKRPARAVVVASLPRSGSTLLGRALTATGQFGVFEEHFKFIGVKDAVADGFRITPTWRGIAGMTKRRIKGDPNWRATSWMTKASKRRYVDWLIEQQIAIGDVFGCKTHWGHYHGSIVQTGLDFATWGVPVEWITITRRDHLGQAVSHARATQTNQWSSRGQAKATPVYDRDRIDQALAMIERSEQAWETYFASRGIEPYRIIYEDLDADYENVVAGVLEHLGAQPPAGGTIADLVAPRQLQRQADELNEQWRVRYLAEADH